MGRRPFDKIKDEDYLEEAISTANFIQTRKVTTENGIYWSIEDASAGKESYYDELTYYSGSSGIIHYFLQLWEVTKNNEYLEDSKLAAEYIIYRWKNKRELGRNFSKWAFTTGYSGAAYSLIELYEITGEAKYKEFVDDVVEEIIKDVKTTEDNKKLYWSNMRSIVGDSGTILFLLYVGKKFKNKKYTDFAVKVGSTLLNEVKTYEKGGRYYEGISPTHFGFPENYIIPNFPMGTAGIGYTLLRLYEESGDIKFLEGVDGLEEFFDNISDKTDKSIYIPYSVPNGRELYYVGYCHGPVGTSRFFYKLYKITGNEKYFDWCKKLINGIIELGAPEKHSPGYWNTHNQCCGTSGLTNTFLGVWAETGDENYLNFAIRTGEQLLGWAHHTHEGDKKQAKWFQSIDRVAPNRVSTAIGLYDGAAGIGWALLQLYLAKKGNFKVNRSIDDPYPRNI